MYLFLAVMWYKEALFTLDCPITGKKIFQFVYISKSYSLLTTLHENESKEENKHLVYEKI